MEEGLGKQLQDFGVVVSMSKARKHTFWSRVLRTFVALEVERRFMNKIPLVGLTLGPSVSSSYIW